MIKRKRFRAILSCILAALTLLHTTPIYAAGGKAKETGSTKSSSPQSSVQQKTTSAAPNKSGGSGAVAQTAGTSDPGGESGSSAPTQAPMEYQSTGALQYSVPIEVPKGRANVAPNLSLTFNSYSGGGWVGVGFSLDMGAIQRYRLPWSVGFRKSVFGKGEILERYSTDS